jgi:V8-like Glu-specific endopeptidase
MLNRLVQRPARRPLRARLTVTVLERRENPSLSPVSASAGFPYTSIVKLYMTFPDNHHFVGSGAMIDSFHVLTAGHCTYSASDGGWASQIQVVPEMNGSYRPFGVAYMTYERTYNSFINYDKAHPGSTSTGINDIGLLTLDRTIGSRTGYMSFGYDNNNSRFAAGRIFNTAGYPAAGGYDGSKMYLSSGGVAGLSSDGLALKYYQSSITTYGGQSGSPVWEYVSSTGARTILAVHVAGTGTSTSLNYGTRITQSIFNDLQNWRNSDVVPSSRVASGLSVYKTWNSTVHAGPGHAAASMFGAGLDPSLNTTGIGTVHGMNGPAFHAQSVAVAAGPTAVVAAVPPAPVVTLTVTAPAHAWQLSPTDADLHGLLAAPPAQPAPAGTDAFDALAAPILV